jgi:WD40 repeat protein
VVAPRSLNLKLEAVSSRLKGELIHPNKTGWFLNLNFSPDGKRIIASDYPGGVAVVWDVANGKQLATIETGERAFFTVSPDWRTLFAPRLKTRKFERVEQDGKRLMRWTFDGEVRAWSLDDGKLLRTYKHNPPRSIGSMELSPDGTRFVTSENVSGTCEQNYKSTTSLWDVKSGVQRTLNGRLSYGNFSPDGRSLTSVLFHENDNYTKALKLIDAATGAEKWSIPITDKNASVGQSAFSQDGRVIFGMYEIYDRPNKWDHFRSWMKWWDAATGHEIASFEGEKDGGFTNFCSSPDGQTLAIVNWKGDKRKLFLYSIAEKRLLRTVLLGEKSKGLQCSASHPAFSPDGEWMVVTTSRYPEKNIDGPLDPRDLPQPRILLIETATGAIRETLVAPQGGGGLPCFSPDGRTLATGGTGRVLLWDMTKMPALTSR